MEIRHDNRNNNQRPQQNQPNNPKRPPGGPGVPGRPKEQKHILAELKAKYGPNFVGVADTYGEFSKGPGKFTQLLRTIFMGRFNFEEYGMYLLDPRILDRLIELAYANSVESQVHYIGTQNLLWNPQICQSYGVDLSNVARQALIDQDKMNAWFKILDILQKMKMTGDINWLIGGVNEMATMAAVSPTVKDLCGMI